MMDSKRALKIAKDELLCSVKSIGTFGFENYADEGRNKEYIEFLEFVIPLLEKEKE